MAALGIAAVFSLNAATYLGVLWVIPRWKRPPHQPGPLRETVSGAIRAAVRYTRNAPEILTVLGRIDRKSTRLNSSHANISYAVFCLQKKTTVNVHVFGTLRRGSEL